MSTTRSNARKVVVQALYQWQMTGHNLNDIEQQFEEEERLANVQKSYFRELFHGIPKHLEKIDALLGKYVDRPVDTIDPVERAVLRLGVYELLYKLEIPYRVVINEAINVAKQFGADGSFRYVNGILDKVSQEIRTL